MAIEARPLTSVAAMASSALTCVGVSAIGVVALAVLLPMMLLAARLAIFDSVTAPAWIMAVIAVVPVPATSPDRVMLWLAVR